MKLLLLPALLLATSALAQTTPTDTTSLPPPSPSPWRKTLKASLGLNEALLSGNWRGGGVNTVGFNALLNVRANRKAGKQSFDNEADFLFAFSETKGLGYRKGQDRLYLDTKYGRALSAHWDMFVSLNLLTQFAPGYDYAKDAAGIERARLVSSFFSPGFLTAAYGFEYRPAPYFRLRLAPFAPRLTVVSRGGRFEEVLGETPYGVNPGHSTRFEVLAAQALAELDKDLTTSLHLKARYLLFANYRHLNGREIDHRLDLGLSAKVGRFVNVALTGIALYDHDQDGAVQLSQGLTIGVAYAVQNFQDEKK